MATQVIFKQGGFLMVTTIGIDPHKATHTAVAIDGSETVLAEITISADPVSDQEADRLGFGIER